MRALIFVVQVVIALFITASLMPLVLFSVPAAQESQALGISLMVALLVGSFGVIALVWPRKKS
jgi:uncharacterized membrane protein YqjE